MASTPAIPITKCPPGAAAGAVLYPHQFRADRQQLVNARSMADGEWESSGVDWCDKVRMGYALHKTFAYRSETPGWTLNDSAIAKVIARYVEVRAQIKKADLPDFARLTNAQTKLQQRMPEMQCVLDGLCKRYIAEKQNGATDSLESLEIEIEGLDTSLRITKNIAAIAAYAVYLYYRLGWDSPAVASELGIKPPHLRMLLMRLRKVAFDLGLGERLQQRLPRPRIQRVVAPDTPKRKRSEEKRHAVVSSAEFIALFEKARHNIRENRLACINGHSICAENAHVADLRRLERYTCDPCNRAVQARYAKKRPA